MVSSPQPIQPYPNGGCKLFSMTKLRCRLASFVEISACTSNALLALCFWIANEKRSTFPYPKPGIALPVEVVFVAGVVALFAAVVSGRRRRGTLARAMLILALTAWNQSCLIAFLAILTPAQVGALIPSVPR